MASAQTSRREVKKMIETTIEEDVITLTLSKDEAETLSEITFRHVSGSSDSPRKHSDAIHNALRAAGVDQNAIIGLGNGRIHFEDYPEPEKPGDSPLKIGDCVRVTEDWHSDRTVPIVGRIGTLTKIDPDDEDGMRFEVRWGVATYDINWAKSVERVSD